MKERARQDQEQAATILYFTGLTCARKKQVNRRTDGELLPRCPRLPSAYWRGAFSDKTRHEDKFTDHAFMMERRYTLATCVTSKAIRMASDCGITPLLNKHRPDA